MIGGFYVHLETKAGYHYHYRVEHLEQPHFQICLYHKHIHQWLPISKHNETNVETLAPIIWWKLRGQSLKIRVNCFNLH